MATSAYIGDEPLAVMLIGVADAGKSSVCNLVFGGKVFKIGSGIISMVH